MDARRGEQKGARDCTTRHRHLDTTALWAFPRAAMNVGSITQLTGYATLPANVCPFSWRREVTCFDEDFGEAVGEAVEANASSVV